MTKNTTHTEIIQRLCQNGFKAFTVGGEIRDMFLGLESDDFDVTTSATPEEVIALFPDKNVKEVGKSFGVVLVDDFEVATFRTDHYNQNDECSVQYANNIHDDLSRRDLTINALAFCEITGELVDDFNGLDDLKNKIIKFVGESLERIAEDPNRIVRACRFLAKLNGTFHPETKFALQTAISLNGMNGIALERVRLEILKAMKIQNASKFFIALHEIGALKLIFPSLDSCWEHDHGNHHVENVFEHCMLAGDAINTKFPLLKLTAYIHDCGKPKSFDPVKKTFYAHHAIGAKLARKELTELKFSNDEINFVASLINQHMNIIHDLSPKAKRKFHKRLFDDNVDLNDFLRLRFADRKANVKAQPFRLSDITKIVKNLTTETQEENVAFDVKALDINGKDLMTEFNLKPSVFFGIIFDHLVNFVIDKGFEFNKREILIAEIQNRFFL